MVDPTAFLFEDVEVIGDVTIGPESSMWPRVVLRGDVNYIRIGARTNLQDFTMVHVATSGAPTLIGDEVTAGHRVLLHGCTVEDRCLIGMGAIVMDEAFVGTGSLIGAGAVVTPGTKIPPNSLVLGAPAKVKREIGEAERRMIEQSWRNYRALIDHYRGEVRPPALVTDGGKER